MDYSDDAEGFIKKFSSSYYVLKHLYPDRELTVKELQDRTGKSNDTILKIIRGASILEVIIKKDRKTGSVGAPQIVASLSDTSRRILDVIYESREKPDEVVKRSLEFFHQAMKTVEADAVKVLAGELYILSTRHRLPNFMHIFGDVYGKLDESLYDVIRVDLLITLRNALSFMDQAEVEESRKVAGGELMKIIERDGKTVTDTRNRVEAIKTFSLLYPSKVGYKKLVRYLEKSLGWGVPEVTSELRAQLIAKFPDEKDALHELVLGWYADKKYEKSKGLIEEMLNSLR